MQNFCVLCPNLSGGREELAHKNILMYYPNSDPINDQVNHAGFCLAVTFLNEQFEAPSIGSSAVDNAHQHHHVETGDSAISIYSPGSDLWIAISYSPQLHKYVDEDVMGVVLERSFDAFRLLHGYDIEKSLTSTSGCSFAHLLTLREYYMTFIAFLEQSVLPQMKSGGAEVGDVLPHYLSPMWGAVAAHDIMLGYTCHHSSISQADRWQCRAIAERHLMSGADASSCNGTSLPSAMTILATAEAGDDGAGDDAPGSMVTEATCMLYAILETNTLRLVASSLPQWDLTTLKTLWVSRGLQLGLEYHLCHDDGGGVIPYRAVIRQSESVIVLILVPVTVFPQQGSSMGTCANAIMTEVAPIFSREEDGVCNSTTAAEMRITALSEENPCRREVAALYVPPAARSGIHSPIRWIVREPDGSTRGVGLHELSFLLAAELSLRVREGVQAVEDGEKGYSAWSSSDCGLVAVATGSGRVVVALFQGTPQLPQAVKYMDDVLRIVAL